MDTQKIWELSLPYIQNELNSVVAYNTYIKELVPVSYRGGDFTLAVTTPLLRNMIDIRYKGLIEGCIFKITGTPVRAVILSLNEEQLEEMLRRDSETAEASEDITAENEDMPQKIKESNLNSRYTFDNFVVGPSNKYAFAAAENVIKFPAQNYNPLFLYGDSGLGKTHLMQAIGHELLKKNPDMRVLYVSSERFTNDMINSVRDKNMEDFRHRYREVDLLLVDDVQFIEGKEGTQEEFFHTFNDLYQNNKQIVLTSDRKPKDLITLEARLRTRFEWGLTIDIVTPDFETRAAILKKKAETYGIELDEDVLYHVAERVHSNVRELEGALSKIVAYAGISHKKIDIETAETALKSILPDEVRITPNKIIEKVASFYHLDEDALTGKSKQKNLAYPRQIAMYLCKQLTEMNFVTIARTFDRDRTTIMHGVDKIMLLIDKDPDLKAEIDYITKDLKNN